MSDMGYYGAVRLPFLVTRSRWGDRSVIPVSREDLMLKDFYVAFSAICFTLLGLWLIVVQTRHEDWRGDAGHRRRAYGVAMNFSLPGLMSLLSLINPDSALLWRVSFAIAALGGAVILVVLRGAAPTRFGLAAYVLAVILYALIALLAIAPGIIAGVGLALAAVRVEAVLLTLLVFLDVNVAWLLLFDDSAPQPAAG
jgi:hypothetical protein